MINWLIQWLLTRELRKGKRKASTVARKAVQTLAICAFGLLVGCSTVPQGGGYHGPLIDPDGQPINPPTYEAGP